MRFEVLLTADAVRDLEEIVDRVAENVYLIVDGRRDLQSLLARRLLGG